jgi:hypothetical protein
MKPKTRSNLSMIGSILIGVSFFLPWFIVVFPELTPVSLTGLTIMQNDSALWGILLGAIVTFILALRTRRHLLLREPLLTCPADIYRSALMHAFVMCGALT